MVDTTQETPKRYPVTPFVSERIRKITDIFLEKDRTFSFEFFPPKSKKGLRNLYRAAEELRKLGPDFFSVTYGAGGSSSKATMEIILELQKRFDIPCMHHLTLVGQTRDDLTGVMRHIIKSNVKNVLALRGDPPTDMGREFRKVEGGLGYCYELFDLIREVAGDKLAIGVAGFPEGHVDCPSKELDTKYLKIKLDHGGDFVITQLFFESATYAEFLERTSRAGVTARIMPGVLPITDYRTLLRFCDTCGAYICQRIHDVFAPIQETPEATRKEGINYVVDLCKELLNLGAPGLHFYCLNSVEPVRTIWKRLGL